MKPTPPSWSAIQKDEQSKLTDEEIIKRLNVSILDSPRARLILRLLTKHKELPSSILKEAVGSAHTFDMSDQSLAGHLVKEGLLVYEKKQFGGVGHVQNVFRITKKGLKSLSSFEHNRRLEVKK